jgi:hypothetical protein
MATTGPSEIENEFARLSPEAQLGLLEGLVHRVRLAVASSRDREAGQPELFAMAADPQIQREIRRINAEFHGADGDGLEEH